MKNLNLLLFSIIFSISVNAQTPSSANMVQDAIVFQNDLIKNSIVGELKFENIGPSIMSGRVSDIEVNPDNPNEFYVAYASGGLWYTKNNGNTFDPVMDNANTQNVGDFDVDWKSNLIVVGTGENNSSRSSYSGIGILKSNDNGKSWENIGLKDSHHIGKVKINPNNPDEIIVGVIGHLYSKNSQRGIFKTKDGGKSWSNTLFIDGDTGIIDLDVDKNNFNVQFASSWERERKAWDFKGNGEKSGIYKSTDAGDTWELVSNQESGFLFGDGVGRIGVAVFDEKTIYAIVDNQFRRPIKEKKKNVGIDKNYFESISKEDFNNIDKKELNGFLRRNGFPEKYDANKVKDLVSSGTILPIDLKLYLEDANTVMFETPIVGAEVYRSDDGGVTWTKKNSYYLDYLYNTYGYYFGRIHVSPVNKDHIYIYGVPFIKSTDGGVTYESIDYENVHVDHHDLWINPKNPNHLVNGNDGGVNISYDNGKNWIKLNQPSVGQFYAINVDYQDPYNVYGGLQDNGVWMAKNNSKESLRWHSTGHNNWTEIMGGDGMQIQIDKRNPNLIYTGYQFGTYFRIDNDSGERKYIKPKHDLGEDKLRFNWMTPILLSHHNQDILYLGSNKLHTSLDRGNNWSLKSKDLTRGIKKGNVPYGTITSIDESKFKFGKIVTGSDDGLVHITNDSGNSWKNISKGLPNNLWISRVTFSQHEESRVYVSLNGYRFDDFQSYVFVSDDDGKNWTSISQRLPDSPVNVIKDDPKHENILYAGTDNGAYISIDKGKNWHPFVNGLNKVAVHDLVIQSKMDDLLLGTHGRSIYKTNLEPIYDLLQNDLSSKNEIYFNVNDISKCSSCGTKRYNWDKEYFEKNIEVIVFSDKKQSVELVLSQEKFKIIQKDIQLKKGFQYVSLPMSYDENGLKALRKSKNKPDFKKSDNGKYYFTKGKYTLALGDYSESFQIK